MASQPYGNGPLIVGARRGSLGDAVRTRLLDRGVQSVFTAGVGDVDGYRHEDVALDVTWEQGRIDRWMAEWQPTSIVCTVGINLPDFADPLGRSQMEVNYFGVMRLLDAWRCSTLRVSGDQFVAISSNSAQIARRDSRGYCASKAALSMGIRVAGREDAGSHRPIYGWEFGLLQGTPMTAEAAERFAGPLTRMPGLPNGIPTQEAARHVVDGLLGAAASYNGCLLRADAGEQ